MSRPADRDEMKGIVEATVNASTRPAAILGPARAPFTGCFRIGYVVSDLDVAAESTFSLLGASGHSRGGRRKVQVGAGRTADIDIATAWAGALQIQLIQPLHDPTGYYAAVLGPGPSPVLHHVGRKFDTIAAAEHEAERYRESGYPVLRLADDGHSRRFSADVRHLVGHYVEGMVSGSAADPSADAPVLGPAAAPFPGLYQLAYVTEDFNRAIGLLTEIY